MSTATLERPETLTTDSPGDAAHIVLAEPGESPQALVLQARVEGLTLTALCGHTWVPSRDPRQLPVCEPCLAIYKNDPHGHGDREELPDD